MLPAAGFSAGRAEASLGTDGEPVTIETRQHVHDLIDRLRPTQLTEGRSAGIYAGPRFSRSGQGTVGRRTDPQLQGTRLKRISPTTPGRTSALSRTRLPCTFSAPFNGAPTIVAHALV